MKGHVAMVALTLTALLFAGCTGVTGERDLNGFVEVAGCNVDDGVPQPVFPVATIETNFGTITADIHLNRVPTTAQNFIDLAEGGAYDDTLSHRIIEDFMMQVGNLNTKGKTLDDYPFLEGGAQQIPDEFHHLLRHDGKGMLSMANSGPNTGSSQFFITFAQTPWLDDRHSIFGQVTEGFDVLEDIEDAAAVTSQEAQQREPPREEVRLESVTIAYEERATIQGFGADLFAYDDAQEVPPGGGWTRFIVVAENQAAGPLPLCLGAEAPEGVTVRIEEAFQTLDLPSQQRAAVVVDVEADGPATVTVILEGPGGELDRLDLTVTQGDAPSRVVTLGDEVTSDYIGITVDGRVFDTSVQEVADKARDEGLGYASFNYRGAYSPYTFTTGGNVIQGFTDIAVGTLEGLSNAGRVPPEDAYGESGQAPLAGRTLIFQLDVLEIQ